MLLAAAAVLAAGPMPCIQAWSFNRFPAVQAIEMAAQAGSRNIELFPGQRLAADDQAGVGPGLSRAQNQRLQEALAKHGVQVVAFGVTDIPRDQEQARRLFTWAKGLGIQVINTESEGSIDTIEAMVKEFDLKVGFHNHPRRANDPNYKIWDPKHVAGLIRGRDQRIGACADTGHWLRSGIRPLDALKTLRGRVVSSHLKDLNDQNTDVPYGLGRGEIAQVVSELRRQKFVGPLSVEYETNWDRNLAEVAQCIGFIRGLGL